MARTTAKLSERRIQTEKRLGRHSDGGNLYLSISPNGGKRWVFMYRFDGRQKEIGLGSAKGGASTGIVRELAQRCRDWLATGKDPKAERETEKAATRASPTFGAFAAEYIASHRSKWRNGKHAEQWQRTIATYCGPIRSMPVNDINTESVLKVLQPIWTLIPETASRIAAGSKTYWTRQGPRASGPETTRRGGAATCKAFSRPASGSHAAIMPPCLMMTFRPS